MSLMACLSYLLFHNRDKQVSSQLMVLDCSLGFRQEYEIGEGTLDCCCLGPSLSPLFYFTLPTFMLLFLFDGVVISPGEQSFPSKQETTITIELQNKSRGTLLSHIIKIVYLKK